MSAVGERERPEGREGIVTVYDHEDRYLGCMGIAVWRELLERENLDRVYDGRVGVLPVGERER